MMTPAQDPGCEFWVAKASDCLRSPTALTQLCARQETAAGRQTVASILLILRAALRAYVPVTREQ